MILIKFKSFRIVILLLLIFTYPCISHGQHFPKWEPTIQGPGPIIANSEQHNEIYNLTLNEAVQILSTNNNSIKQADIAIEIAKSTRQKLNSLWFPFISAAGGYTHFSEDIETRNNIGELISKDGNILTPIKEALQGKLPTAQELTQILGALFPQIGQQEIANIIKQTGIAINDFASAISASTLTVPIMDKDVGTVDITAAWPVFTGGKRIYSSKIGNIMVEQAQNLKGITYDNQVLMLITAYYTLKLSNQVIEVREQNLNAMTMLYNDALKLSKAGMINKAEMLTAQVAMENAIRELENSNNAETVVNKALVNLLNPQDSSFTNIKIIPVSNFADKTMLPDESYFNALILEKSKVLQAIDLQKEVVKNQKKMATSEYLPNIGVFAKQSIYSYHIPSNLSPNTVVGAAFTWNIFDGLNREMNIKLANRTMDELEISNKKIYDDLTLGIRTFLTQAQDALYNLRALESTIELCKELIDVREKSFKEGMATTTDVVFAHTSLANAMLGVSAANYQYSIALANLMIISGIGEEFFNN